MEFTNAALRKEIKDVLAETQEDKLVDALEALFEKWYDARICACLA